MITRSLVQRRLLENLTGFGDHPMFSN